MYIFLLCCNLTRLHSQLLRRYELNMFSRESDLAIGAELLPEDKDLRLRCRCSVAEVCPAALLLSSLSYMFVY